MPLYSRTLPSGFIAPCLPSNAAAPPSGKLWLHEGQARRVPGYCARPANGWGSTADRAMIVEALALLRSRSCIIDGEAWRRPPRRGRDRGSTVRICGARGDCRTGSRAKSRTRLAV